MEYFIRRLDNKHCEVAKFESGKEPVEVYTLTENLSNGYIHCSCLGFRKNPSQDHKHVIMQLYFVEHGYNHFSDNLVGEKIEF